MGAAPAPADAPAPTLGDGETVPAVGARVKYFGDYELLEEVARGGMGVVYRARQVSLNRVVAVKMILAGGHAGGADLERFFSEAKAVAQLQHANLVQLYETGVYDGLPYLTLEYVPGGSLADKLKGTPLPPREAARLVEQAARGVQHAHEKGIVHRDLKPANVLLGADGTAKVTDFGLARRVDGSEQLTATGAVLGTPPYMAPEQASGESNKVGPAADVYGLGAVLYECLTGRPPFQAPTPLETLMQVMKVEPVSPSQLQPQVPRDLETICLKCLQKEPGKRYASAAGLAEDLRRYQAGEPIVARPVGRVERMRKWCRRNPTVASSLGVLLLGAAVSTWLAIEARYQTQQALTAQSLAEQRREEVARQLERASSHLFTAQLMRVASVYERDPALALELLHNYDACPIDRRDFAWGWYQRQCRRLLLGPKAPPASSYCAGFTGGLNPVAFSPDGKTLFSVLPGRIKLSDVATGKERADLPGPPGVENGGVVFSADGKTLAAVSGWRIMLWDVAAGQERTTLSRRSQSINSLVFSADGKTLASVSEGRIITLWDVGTGKEHVHLEGTTYVHSVAISADGKSLALGHKGTVRLWDVITGQERAAHKIYAPHVPIQALTFSPDGKTLALAGSEEGTIMLLDAASGHERAYLKGHAQGARRLVWLTPINLQHSSGRRSL
jgi:eukaryotic-like serine/threonine-protein kinase